MIPVDRLVHKNMLKVVLAGLLVFSFLVPVVYGADKVNINTADKQQLMTLKYIGEVLAQKIIEYRKTSPFQKPEDIMKVSGVGEKTFEANKDRIIVKDE
jgi:competence protein ComEA